jgi:hypothetical protein
MRTITHKIFTVFALAAILVFTGCAKSNNSAVKPAVTANSLTAEEMVLTPVGYMEKSKVHFIDQGFSLHVENGRLQKVETRSGKMVEDFGEVKMNDERFNLNRNAVPAGNVEPAAVSGWIAYTYWSNPITTKPITYFSTSWVVPAVPKKQGNQTLFLFNGMQDGATATSYIIQPVLQWGSSAAGGGKYWAITNWYVSSSQAFFGSLVKVSTGTTLQGIMTQTAVSGSNYSYNSSFTGYPTTTLNATNVPQAFWAAETLESYGVTTPNTMYPPNVDVAMKSIEMLQGSANSSITWTTAQATKGAAQKAVVVSSSSSNGEVDIYFRK